MRRAAAALALAALAGSAPGAHAARLPSWAEEAVTAAGPAPTGGGPGAEVLLSDVTVTIGSDGRSRTTLSRFVLRVLAPEGRDRARFEAFYATDGGRVRSMRVWVLRPSGEVIALGSKQAVDVALLNNDVYNEYRLRRIDATEVTVPGAVVACETEVESTTPIPHVNWEFQNDLPTRLARLTVEAPEGWVVSGHVVGHAPVAPRVEGDRTTWELSDLPSVPTEIGAPPLGNLVPRALVTCVPPEGSGAPEFRDWSDVARWIAGLAEGTGTPDERVERTAHELVAGATGELDSVRRIARFVQRVRYASIQLGTGRGGGFTPRPAGVVLAHDYGDCKDKANLMRSLLDAVGIRSYLTLACVDDPARVRPELPSPAQFDHCILSVELARAAAPASAALAVAGRRLLPFDPTDPWTRLGDLPEGEQGGRVLVVAPGVDSLVRLPVLPVDSARTERRLSLDLAADGSIVGRLEDQLHGQAAAAERGLLHEGTAADYRDVNTRWLARAAPGARLVDLTVEDDSLGTGFGLEARFLVPRYAQALGGGLMAFRPAVLAWRRLMLPDTSGRVLPYALGSAAVHEVVQVTLPPGFRVDELPPPVALETDFGSYHASCTANGRALRFEHRLVTRGQRVPAGRYPELKRFLDSVRDSERSPVILARE